MLPAEVRERIDLESQAEIGRTQATRVWEKAGQYEDAMEKASRGEPQPAPWRAAIEADPDLDDRTRARLLQKHDAMQQKLDRFWSIKAEYDKRNGRKFDGNDDNDRTFVEQMYTRLGADMPALHAVANRAGIMPEAALDDFKGRLRSQDPDKVSQALSDLQGLARRFESLSTLGGKETADLQNDLSEFVFYRRAGRLKDQAVQEFIKARSPEAEAQRQAKLKGVDIHAPDLPGPPMAKDEPAALGVPSSEAQAVVPQEMPATSQVPTPQGAAKQEQPLGVGRNEPAPTVLESEVELPVLVEPTNSPNLRGAKSTLSSHDLRAIWQQTDLAKHDNADEYHPLDKHSGKSQSYLQDRLDQKKKMKVASTFRDDAEANTSFRLLLRLRAPEVEAWFADPKGPKDMFFEMMLSEIGPNHPPVGLVLEKGASVLKPGNGVAAWLRKDASMPEGFRVITVFVLP